MRYTTWKGSQIKANAKPNKSIKQRDIQKKKQRRKNIIEHHKFGWTYRLHMDIEALNLGLDTGL